MISIKDYLLQHKPCAVCVNEASRLGKDWFFLTLSKSVPYYRDVSITEYEEIREVKSLIIAGELVLEYSDKYGSCYVLKGTSFKSKYQANKAKCKGHENY